MSCLPNTPIAFDRRDSGLVAFSSVDTGATTQYYPISTEVLTLPRIAQHQKQAVKIVQFTVRETATSSANIKKNALHITLHGIGIPAAPTLAAVYNPSVTNLIGKISVVAGDYIRVSDTVWEAHVYPSLASVANGITYYTTLDDATAINLYATVQVSGAAPPAYAASAGIALRIITELAQIT